MLAMLKNQIFEIGQTDFQVLESEITTKWARHERVQGKIHHVAMGSTEEFISLQGKLVMKNDSSLEGIKEIVKDKKPVLLTFGSGFAYWVVAIGMQIKQEKFTTLGAARIKSFTLQLERFYYGN